MRSASSAFPYTLLAGRCSARLTLVPPGGGENPALNIAMVRVPPGEVTYAPIDGPPCSMTSSEVAGPIVTILKEGSEGMGVVKVGSGRLRQSGSVESIRIQ